MRVGLIIYGSPESMSGGYLYDRTLVAHLRARGDEVEIISLPTSGYASRAAENLRVRLPRGLDLVLQDELAYPSLLACNAARREFPCISIVHNLHSSERRARWKNAAFGAIERLYLRSVDGYIFNSRGTQASVEALVPRHGPSIVAAPGGDRLGGCSQEEVASRAHQTGPLRLLFLANVTALKGLQVVLDGLESLPPGICALDVVGSCDVEPVYASVMRRRAARLSTRVTFHGILDGRPLTEMLRMAQVMVVPSYYEGFGIAYLEGMAFGLPAIATTAGAVPELVIDGGNGYLVMPGDSQSLARRLQELAADRAKLERLGSSALKSFRSRPTWAESAEAVRRFLVGMLGARGSHCPQQDA